MHLRCRTPRIVLLLLIAFSWGTPTALLAAEPVPVWIYDANNFESWRTPQGELRGFYPSLIQAINRRLEINLVLNPLSGSEIGQRFASNQYGVYAGVLRTEKRARTKILSARLFDNEVVAASASMTVTHADQLNHTRVLFRRDDATLEGVKQRYPDLRFRSLRLVETSEEAPSP